jgi:siderophore synthetase component
VNPDTLTAQSLLNCLVREVSLPEEQTREGDGYLIVRLARSDRRLRLGTRRRSAGVGPRLTGDAEIRCGDTWQPVGWARLATLIAEELTLATGMSNDEFTAQVRGSNAAIRAILQARKNNGTDVGTVASGDLSTVVSDALGTVASGGLSTVVSDNLGPVVSGSLSAIASNDLGPVASDALGADAPGDPRIAGYLSSEQALVGGHRFHPAPKARSGEPGDWLPYAPEAGARFPLRFLAVRGEALDTDGDTTAVDRLGAPAAPAGYHVLPAHPWQLRLLAGRPWLRRAFRDRVLIDLGDGSRAVVPTSSVRTVYDPVADVFCKFSLNVRITNCFRKNAWYELAGAVALTALLGPVTADLAARFPGATVLGEPGYRTVALPDVEAVEGLSVILREGLGGCLEPGVTPLLAAALTEYPGGNSVHPDGAAVGSARGRVPGALASDLFDRRDPDWLLTWWEAYVRQVAPPVLHALFGHGIVFEPHLQNVLIGVDGDGLPVQAVFRDLEGVKLVMPRHDQALAALKPEVARALGYDSERGWHRVAYCLFVNNLAEIAAAIADRHFYATKEFEAAGEFEAALWDRARDVLTGFGRDHGWPPQLRAMLAGVPLPAKANLRLRWARGADREAAYLSVRNPLGGQFTGRKTEW